MKLDFCYWPIDHPDSEKVCAFPISSIFPFFKGMQGMVINYGGVISNFGGNVQNNRGMVENVRGQVQNFGGAVKNTEGTVFNEVCARLFVMCVRTQVCVRLTWVSVVLILRLCLCLFV